MRLVVVEDNAAMRARLCSMLGEVAGLTVIAHAADGESALTALAAHAPEVMLIDLHLPDMSGLELIARIKAASSRTRVVAITNLDDRFYRREALERGADAFVGKAAPFADLVAAVTAELSDNR